LIIVILCTLLVFILIFGGHLLPGNVVLLVVISGILFLLTMCLFSLCLQPTTKQKLSFKVPLVPFLPTVSIFVNIYLVIFQTVFPHFFAMFVNYNFLVS
jgi:hypothetical protein